MTRTIFRPAALSSSLALILAACATAPEQASAPSFPTALEREEVAAEPPPPALAEAGSAAQVWQLRSALNVAALGCTRAGDNAISGRYNNMLKLHSILLTQAYIEKENQYRKTGGKRWQTIQDREATKLYNRYANHPRLDVFCKEAGAITADALRVSSEDFPRFAAAALPRLETPGMMDDPIPAPKPAAKATAKKPAPRPAAKKG